MRLCAINTFTGDKKNRIQKHYILQKKILEASSNTHLDIISKNFGKVNYYQYLKNLFSKNLFKLSNLLLQLIKNKKKIDIFKDKV